MVFLDLLEGQPALLLHQVDQTEVARTENHDRATGDVVLGTLLRLGARGLAEGVPDHYPLLVAAGEAGDLATGERSLNELVEPVAVSLLERRTLSLSVVGEHHDLVGARCVPPRAFDG